MMPNKPPLYRPPEWRPAPKRPEVQDPYYQSAEWRQLRQQCLERDRHQCTMPNCPNDRGRGGRLVADHIVERRKGGADALYNLRSLCAFCDGVRHGHRALRRL
jgi:5-methylcytosine-specific restriction endonuclease McrA